MNYPLDIEEITCEWLTSVLTDGFPTHQVRSLRCPEVIQGTASKVRLQLGWSAVAEAAGRPSATPPTSMPPAAMIAKGGFSAHRELMYREYMLEARFYREVAPQLQGVRVPRSFHAGWNDRQRQAIVLLEDLDVTGGEFCRVQRPLSYEQAKGFIELLASLHAQWWMSGEFGPDRSLSWVDHLDPFPEGELGAYQRSRIVPGVYAECMSLPRGIAVSRRFHDRDRMEQALERLRKVDREGPWCLLHTDPHLGNLYFDAGGRPGILDWQSLRRGPWAHDVNYFLVSSLDMVDRREWEKPLLQHYLEALRRRGVDAPRFDEAWEAYRRQTVYGLYYWLVNPVEFQAEINNCAVAPRFAFAAIDHDTFSLLDV